jgi:hypothetical protein
LPIVAFGALDFDELADQLQLAAVEIVDCGEPAPRATC